MSSSPCTMSSALQHGNPWVSKQLIPYNHLEATWVFQISTTQSAVLYNNKNVAVFVLQLGLQFLLLDSRWLSRNMEVVTNELNSARLEGRGRLHWRLAGNAKAGAFLLDLLDQYLQDLITWSCCFSRLVIVMKVLCTSFCNCRNWFRRSPTI